MSSNQFILTGNNSAIINTDLSKIFIGSNRYDSFDYNNDTYDPVTLYAGRLMGRNSTTGLLQVCDADATDGSQYPIGILAGDYTIQDGATNSLAICVEGDVVTGKVTFTGVQTMDTVVDSRRLRDRIGADTVGIKLVDTTDHTYYDNQPA